MSKSANVGELRTAVYFKYIERVIDSEGFPQEQELNVFGENNYVLAKWVNVHGSEVFTAMQLELKEPVTLTVRYSAKINSRLIVYKVSEYEEAIKAGNDDQVKQALERVAYEVVSFDDVENRHVWIELKIQRKVAAR